MMMQDKIEMCIKPTIEDMGYELWGCEYLFGRQQALVRIYIDKVDGIGIEDCEQVSHQVGALLEVEQVVSGDYRLEISSPGIPRPLFYPWQYRRYIGQKILVKLFQPHAGKRNLIGIISAVNESGIQLRMDEESLELLFANIVKASLQE